MIKKFVRGNTFYQKSSSQYHRGGILLTALLFMLLYSSVLLILLEDHRVTQNQYLVTRDLYLARSMKEMFLQEYRLEEKPPTPVNFSSGILTYTESKDQLMIRIVINQQVYNFPEEIKTDTE